MAFKILIMLVLFLTVFFLLRMLTMALNFIVQKKSNLKNLLIARPITEFTIWIFTFFYAINYLFGERLYYDYFMILFLVIFISMFAWFWLKDWISGVIFRTQHNFRKGEYILLKTYVGHVQNIGSTHISIDTPEGKTLKIPYSQLIGHPVSEHFEVAGTGNASFEVTVNDVKNERQILDQVQETTHLSPWHLQSKIPMVKILERTDNQLKIEVVVHTRNKEHAMHLEKAVKDQFEA